MNLITINNETILPIVVYGRNNRANEMVEYHKKVMVDHFGLPMNYIECPFPMVSHGYCITQLINQTIDTIKPTYYFFCDCDSIFLKRKTFDIMYDSVKYKNGIWSQVTQSNHKKGPNGTMAHPYASQASLCFATEIYDKLGRPDLDHYSIDKEEFGGDTCEILTYKAKKAGYMISLIYPSHSICHTCDLDNGLTFGYGNTYGPNLMYHQMQSNNTFSYEQFTNKCKEVLDGKYE